MSFSCPHFDISSELCRRLKCECIPGRPGCVLPKTTQFAVSAADRIASSTHPQKLPPRKARPASRKPGH